MNETKEALEQFRESEEYTSIWRGRAEADLVFAAGDQWPEKQQRRREGLGLPCLTIDRLEGPLSQLVGDQRRNDIYCKVVARKTAATKMQTQDGEGLDESEFLGGVLREIQRKSRFEWVQATAFEHAVVCGLGGWYVDTEYESAKSFDQILAIRRITTPLAIYPDIKGWGTRDGMGYCFITDDKPKLAFQAEWPKATSEFTEGPWQMQDAVRVAHWWSMDYRDDILLLLGMPDGSVRSMYEAEADEKLTGGATIIRERKVKVPTVMHRVITQAEILEETQWVGTRVPVALVTGREMWVDGHFDLQGMYRKAKDAQRMYNYYRSATAEAMGIAPKAPYIMTPKQVDGHEDMWAQANDGEYSYLLVNPDTQAPGWPHRNQLSYPQGFYQEAQIAAADIMAVTKVHEAGLGARSNETSGVAIEQRQREGDIGNYIYTDNLLLAIEETGRILIDALPKVYDSTRLVTSRGLDGDTKSLVLNKPMPDGTSINSLDGDYDVEVISGPAFGTARQEAVSAMTELFRVAPQLAAIGADIWIRSQDWPGADEFADRIKRTLPPQVTGDDKQDQGAQLAQMQQALQQAEQAIQQMQAEGQALAQQVQQAGAQNEDLTRKLQAAQDHLAMAVKQTQLVKDAAQVEIDKLEAIMEVRELIKSGGSNV